MVGRDLGKVTPWNILSKIGTISQLDDFIGCMAVESVRLALELEQCNGWSLHGPQDRRQRPFGLPQQRVYTVGWPTVCRELPGVDPARVPTDICVAATLRAGGRRLRNQWHMSSGLKVGACDNHDGCLTG